MNNENTRLPNRSTVYLARSGHGKSQCLKRRSGIPIARARVVLWDPNKDHAAGIRTANFNHFLKVLQGAHNSGRSFSIAYTGKPTRKIFELFCQAVSRILDGSRMTYLVIEEYGAVCGGAGPLPQESPQYLLWTQGRKYGLQIHAVTQRPQSITKDALDNAGVIWAGNMGVPAAKRVAEYIDTDAASIRSLKKGEFFNWKEGDHTPTRIQVFIPRD